MCRRSHRAAIRGRGERAGSSPAPHDRAPQRQVAERRIDVGPVAVIRLETAGAAVRVEVLTLARDEPAYVIYPTDRAERRVAVGDREAHAGRAPELVPLDHLPRR